jgi:hypothetical protein
VLIFKALRGHSPFLETTMSSEEVPNDDDFELDSIKRRVEARKIARAAEILKKQAEDELNRHLMERAVRAKNRPAPAPVVVTPWWTIGYSALVSFIKSKILHNVLAYSTLTIMVGWLGFYVNNIVAERSVAAFRDHCLENNLKYASGSRMYCYDDHRFAYVIKDTGVTNRLNADWGVNNRQLLLAAKAADHAGGPAAEHVADRVAGPVAKPVAKAVNGLASVRAVGSSTGTAAELAAQLMHN